MEFDLRIFTQLIHAQIVPIDRRECQVAPGLANHRTCVWCDDWVLERFTVDL